MAFSENWQKVQPSTSFGTPALDFYVIEFQENIQYVIVGEESEPVWQLSNSTFAKAILGIQSIAELYMVVDPVDRWFTVAVARDSHPGSRPGNYRSENTYMSDAITAATGKPCYAYHAAFEGGSFYYND